jgi:hypothetical protein
LRRTQEDEVKVYFPIYNCCLEGETFPLKDSELENQKIEKTIIEVPKQLNGTKLMKLK